MALVELLAPAGSFDSMRAAVNAGADAVYMGGTRFGARAYAENPKEDGLLQAIEYVHLHGRKLYLTVNTLLKERELEEELYPYLRPYYESGLDAVIVQDFGVLRRIREWFPDLPIHASTQMTMTGPYSAKALEAAGVSRIVTPRELNLAEIAEIRRHSSLEIETFVHGALCYCYSGQCLYSSLAGGRSGNRGRCAQPCRMEYRLYGQKQGGQPLNQKEERYLLSPKDLNAITLLPELFAAGVNSLKIEGRMKKPVYTAGVVSIYRKYVDLYLEKGKSGYRVDPADQQKLWDLFNRKGFTEGYFKQQNGRNMITLTKPDFRPGNEAFQNELQKQYIDDTLQEKVRGTVTIVKEAPAMMTLALGDTEVCCQGQVPMAADNRPVTEESIRRQMSKFGGTDFVLEQLDVFVEDGLFLPIPALNALRRQTVKALRTGIIEVQKRNGSSRSGKEKFNVYSSEGMVEKDESRAEKAAQSLDGVSEKPVQVCASVETLEQLEAVLSEKICNRIYLDSLIAPPAQWKQLTKQVHAGGAEAFLALPRVFRDREKQYMQNHLEACKKAGFDGFLVRTIEEWGFLKENGISGRWIADHMLYTWNQAAIKSVSDLGAEETTVPLELNCQEWRERGIKGSEVIVYGRLPMMVSAQCLKKTIGKCNGKQEVTYLKDRTGAMLPVKNVCSYCEQVIYNGYTMSILDEWQTISGMGPTSVRLSFTVENGTETKRVLQAWRRVQAGDEGKLDVPQLTKGHFRRGVQ